MESDPSASTLIGFAPPLLGDKPLRLKVLLQADDFLVVEKPVGVVSRRHPDFPGLPILDEAIDVQLLNQKPELLRMGLQSGQRARSVFFLESGIFGASLITLTEEAKTFWRNAWGSSLIRLTFRFYTKLSGVESATCDLPLIWRRADGGKMQVSHRHGKKCETRFLKIRDFEALGISCWEAETSYLRPNQIMVHAMETGVPVFGDAEVVGTQPYFPPPARSPRRGGNSRAPRVWWRHPHIELSRMEGPGALGVVEVTPSPERQQFEAMLKRRTGEGS